VLEDQSQNSARTDRMSNLPAGAVCLIYKPEQHNNSYSWHYDSETERKTTATPAKLAMEAL
jgi:hypothetical protein